jgi:hypothetical protein
MNTPYILKNNTFPSTVDTAIIDLSEIAFFCRGGTRQGIPVLEVCFKSGTIKEIVYDNPDELENDFNEITTLIKNKTQSVSHIHPVDERSIEPPEGYSDPSVLHPVDRDWCG